MEETTSLSDYILENAMTRDTIINKYEHAQIISKRLGQLLDNEKSTLLQRNIDSLEAHNVAELELENGIIPVDLYRRFPGNSCTKVDLQTMKLVPSYHAVHDRKETETPPPQKKAKIREQVEVVGKWIRNK